jgi:hypothetical protein
VIQRFNPAAIKRVLVGTVPGLKAFGRIEATRVIDGKTETDARIFVLSRRLSPKALLETARDHWQIENALHWQHDVSFGEDAARNRKDNGPSNIAVIRRRALDGTPRSEQGISDCQAEASGMERRVHAKAADSNAIALRPQGSTASRMLQSQSKERAMGELERNSQNVVAFYDLMFNQCRPSDAIARARTSTVP